MSSGKPPSGRGSFLPNQEHDDQEHNTDFDPPLMWMSTDNDATQCPSGYSQDPRVERVPETMPNEQAPASQHGQQQGASRSAGGGHSNAVPSMTPGTVSSSAGADNRPKKKSCTNAQYIEMQKQAGSRKKKSNTNSKAPIVDDSESESN